MFKVNDYIMYGTTGVCKIIDIKKQKFLGREGILYIRTSLF